MLREQKEASFLVPPHFRCTYAIRNDPFYGLLSRWFRNCGFQCDHNLLGFFQSVFDLLGGFSCFLAEFLQQLR